MKISPKSSKTSFLDLLFNMLFVVTILFLVTLIYVNPIGNKNDQDIPKQAEYLIVMKWDEGVNVDIDLWVRNQDRLMVGYLFKDQNFMHLERDDIGMINETYSEGLQGEAAMNRNLHNEETIVFRSKPPGSYTVNAHYYRGETLQIKNASSSTIKYIDRPVTVTIQLIKLNPTYRVVFIVKHDMVYDDQEITFFNFDLDEDGDIVTSTINQIQHMFVNDVVVSSEE